MIDNETREKLFKEIEALLKAGVSIEVRQSHECSTPSKETGYAKLYGSSVRLSIREDDPIELTIDNIVKAGELVDEALKIKNYEINHPDFFTALSRRVNKRQVNWWMRH